MLARATDDTAVLTSRSDYYERIAIRHMTPLWEVLGALGSAGPKPRGRACHLALCRSPRSGDGGGKAHHGRGSGTPRPDSRESGDAGTVLHHVVALRGAATDHAWRSRSSTSAHAVGTASRARWTGAYTAVDGERTTMHRGDFIITPSWTWHDHGNLGTEPVVWLDGLDIPILRFLAAGFAEKSEEKSQTQLRPEGDAQARYGSNMVPVDFHQTPTEATRMFVYPYAQTKSALHGIGSGTPDPHFGFKLRYVNPATGASPMPTIGAYAQALPQGFETLPYRCTDGTVYVCLKAKGKRSSMASPINSARTMSSSCRPGTRSCCEQRSP